MFFEELLHSIVPPLTAILELVGVFIIILGSCKALFLFFKSKFNFENEDLKLQLAQSLALSLEFKLGAEILKTVVVRTSEEFILLGAIVILRVIMTLVIHWEIKSSNEFKEREKNKICSKEENKNNIEY